MSYKISQMMPYFDEDEIKELTSVIANKWVTEGPKSKEFVNKLLEFTGAKFGVLMPNGTLALYAALKVLGIKEGDEVLVPDFTFIASANAIYLTGAKPVFIDVNRTNFNIRPELCQKRITKKTKAIMPVHVYGQSADMGWITEVAKKNNLSVVEDAAQGLGVKYNGRHVGTLGSLGCLSFFADKTITTGEGGMVLTDDERLHEKLLYFRNQGRLKSGSFRHPYVGYNFRLTDLQCAVGLAQMRKFEFIKNRKLKNYRLYQRLLSDLKEVRFLNEFENSNFVPFRVNVLVERLEALLDHLEKNAIQTRRFFYPLHRQPCYKMYRCKDKDYTNSIYAYRHGLSLPVHLNLKENDINYICKAIKTFYGK